MIYYEDAATCIGNFNNNGIALESPEGEELDSTQFIYVFNYTYV